MTTYTARDAADAALDALREEQAHEARLMGWEPVWTEPWGEESEG